MSQFIYLLNAFEQASQSKEPAIFGYAAKRQALLDYVLKLETPPPEVAATVSPEQRCRERLDEAKELLREFLACKRLERPWSIGFTAKVHVFLEGRGDMNKQRTTAAGGASTKESK